MTNIIDPKTGRLTIATVDRMHRLLGGDNNVEGMVLDFIRETYNAPTLLHVPEAAAKEILKRPSDFIRAVKEHAKIERPF